MPYQDREYDMKYTMTTAKRPRSIHFLYADYFISNRAKIKINLL